MWIYDIILLLSLRSSRPSLLAPAHLQPLGDSRDTQFSIRSDLAENAHSVPLDVTVYTLSNGPWWATSTKVELAWEARMEAG